MKQGTECALIVGGSSGIGEAVARRFSACGMVTISTGRAAIVCEGLPLDFDQQVPAGLDICSEDSVDLFGRFLESAGIEIDVMVVASGAGRFVPLSAADTTQIADSIALNLTAPLRLTQRLLGRMRVSSSIVPLCQTNCRVCF